MCYRYIKPAIIGSWNLWKIGVDTISRLIKNVEVYQEHLQGQQRVFLRYKDTVLVFCFRIFQIIQSYEWIQSDECIDLKQLRLHVNRQGGSFGDFVWRYTKELARSLGSPVKPTFAVISLIIIQV